MERRLQAGTLAGQVTGAWLAGRLGYRLAPSTKGLWRALQLPESSSPAYRGTFFAIPRGAPQANNMGGYAFACFEFRQTTAKSTSWSRWAATPAASSAPCTHWAAAVVRGQAGGGGLHRPHHRGAVR